MGFAISCLNCLAWVVQSSGAVITMVTKSGSNQFHGGIFYNGRNDALNSWDYFARQARASNPREVPFIPVTTKLQSRQRRRDRVFSRSVSPRHPPINPHNQFVFGSNRRFFYTFNFVVEIARVFGGRERNRVGRQAPTQHHRKR